MKSRHILTVILVLTLMLLLSGCGRPDTPEEIWADCQNALTGAACTRMETNVELSCSMDLPAMGQFHTNQMDVKANTLATLGEDPGSGCLDLTMDLSVVTPDEDFYEKHTVTNGQFYSLMEEGGLVTYSHFDGKWTRTEQLQEHRQADGLTEHTGLIFQLDPSAAQWDGRSAVCLTTTITGQAAQDALDTAMRGVSERLSPRLNMDLTALSCDVRIYIDPKTHLPLAQELSVCGVEDGTVCAPSDEGAEVRIQKLTAVTQYLSYEAQPPVQLPEGARENALRWERLLSGADNGDGTFTIRTGSALADIATPDGMEPCGCSYEHVSFAPEGMPYVVTYRICGAGDGTPMDRLQESLSSADENGIFYAQESRQVTVNGLDFSCAVITFPMGEGPEKVYQIASAPLWEADDAAFYVEVRITDSLTMEGPGKNGLTIEDLLGLLDVVSPSELME